MKTSVIHIKNKSGAANEVYIGRPSIFGNPFVIGRDGNRSEVIAKFRKYFYNKLSTSKIFATEVEKLRGKKLVCYCHPLSCHGDVIAEYLNKEEK